jgi:hypothetical protein
MKKKDNIKDVHVAARLNWLCRNTLVKTKQVKMVSIVFVNVAEIKKGKNL